jgi:hypothetical protein
MVRIRLRTWVRQGWKWNIPTLRFFSIRLNERCPTPPTYHRSKVSSPLLLSENSRFPHRESFLTRPDQPRTLHQPTTTLKKFPPYLAERIPMPQETRVLLGSAFSSNGSNQTILTEPSDNYTEELNNHHHRSIPIDRYKRIKRKLRKSAKKHRRSQSKLHAPILTPPSNIVIADTWGDLPMTPSLSTRIVLQNINGI